jgi:hypothetical protein
MHRSWIADLWGLQVSGFAEKVEQFFMALRHVEGEQLAATEGKDNHHLSHIVLPHMYSCMTWLTLAVLEVLSPR